MNLAGFPSVMLFLLSIYGWGRLCRAFCDARILKLHSLSAVIGLALLNFIGGLLNLFKWATASLLFALLLAGSLLAGMDLVRTRPWRALASSPRTGSASKRRWLDAGTSALPIVLALIAGGGACLTLMPTTLFNAGDDFHTYVPRVVRMVQTGSVGGNAFDASGLDSLGSQSFFHGFFLSGPDIELLNGFDAVACFTLVLLVVAEISLRLKLPWYVGTLGVICLAAINPQYVNISPLYSGALLIAGLVVTGAVLAKALAAGGSKPAFRSEMTLALIASTLVTLKLTLALFALFYQLLFWVLLYAQSRQRRRVLWSALKAGCWSGALVLPWALVHLPVLLKAKRLGLEFHQGATIVANYPSMAAHDIAGLFSFEPLLYGNNPPAFHLLVVISLMIALGGLWLWRLDSASARGAGLISIVAAGFSVPLLYLLTADLFTAETGIRYSCPALIGVIPVGCVCCLRFCRASSRRQDYRRGIVLSLILMCGIILTFSTNYGSRVRRAVENRTLLSFPLTQPYIDLMKYMVSEGEIDYTRGIQTRMEPGTGALIWIVAPFHLNFRRNRLFLVSEGGLTSPSLQLPAGVSLDALKDYLRHWGIRYVLIETKGGAVREEKYLEELLLSPFPSYRKVGDYAIYFRKSLLTLAQRSRFRYFDGRMLLFELDPVGKE
jgi:hypothetical protein